MRTRLNRAALFLAVLFLMLNLEPLNLEPREAHASCPPVTQFWTCQQLHQLSFGVLEVFGGNPADASVVITGNIPGQRTAIDLWPHNGPLPDAHARTEFVLYGSRFMDWPNFRRISRSAMFDDTFRDSIEFRGGPAPRYVFCFDDFPSAGEFWCPMLIDIIDGLQACDREFRCRKLAFE